VYLITVPECHFDLDYYGSPGIMVTPEVKGTEAVVNVKTFVKGNYDRVRVTISGVGTSEVGKSTVLDEGSTMIKEITTAETVFTISDVHLWDGIKDPYLYQAKAELIVNGEIVDEVYAKFGCRTYSFNAEKGFFLNGESYPLRGVSRHQDRKGVGNALTKEMQEEDMEIILDIGANSIRLAHYQHDQYFYDLCDEKGIVVWAEIPYITEHMPQGRENTLTQMTELIAQNYNHPSIICWALSNEITLTGVTEDLLENHRLLNDLAHSMDPTRVTAMANLFMLETDSPMLDIPDIVSYNLYYGWYLGELEDNERFFDDFHLKYPDKVIGLAEYGADTFYQLQSPNPLKGDYSEQYQCIYHEYMLEMIAKRPYLWSTYVWNMFDFAADAREEAGDNGVNHKGLVSFDRSIKKDAFYLYKAWWSDKPFVHLCGSRYVERTEEVTEVKVYSNLSRIALYKDGDLVMEKEGAHVFEFQLTIEGEHLLEVVGVTNDTSGQSLKMTDSIKIRKVKTPNPAYFLNSVPVKNWFEETEIEIIPGYFSIKDTLGEIKRVPAGKEVIDQMMIQMTAYQGDMAQNVVITDSIRQMMDRFTVQTLLKQAGEISQDMVVTINKELSKIKKPE
jgi:beta-galactosidase